MKCQQDLSVCHQERQTADGYGGRLPRGRALTQSWQGDYIRQLPVAPGGYKWTLTEIDTYSGIGFAYPMVDANAQNTVKNLEQKIQY